MTLEQYQSHPGCKVTCTVKEVKGECTVSHKVGDTFEIDGHTPGSLCGALYYAIYPWLRILEHGGTLYGATVLLKDCPDRANAVTVELRPNPNLRD